MTGVAQSAPVARWHRWLEQGGWSFLDQGLFAFSNFALNVLLAKWITESQYGSFSVAFSVFLFFGVIYSGLMIEPMLVFGGGRYAGRFGGYLDGLLRFHWGWVTAGMTAACLMVACCYRATGSFWPLVVLALCSGPVFYQWLMRRACYAESRPRVAAIGGGVYLLVMTLGLAALRMTGQLVAVTGLLAMTVASLAAAWWIRAGLRHSGNSIPEAPADREIAREHWNYGKWAIASGACSWIPGNLPLLLLPAWHGEAASGALRAMFNLVLPANQVLATLGPLVLVGLVRCNSTIGFTATMRKLALGLVGLTLGYALVLLVLGKWLVALFYGGRYGGQLPALWILGLQPVSAALIMVYASGLRAMERPQAVFKGYGWACPAAFVIGIPLTYAGGVWGAALSMTLCSALIAGFLWLVFSKREVPTHG